MVSTIDRLRKKATDRGLEDLDYYILLDSFYNIKISRMLDVPLWTCGWLAYFVYYIY